MSGKKLGHQIKSTRAFIFGIYSKTSFNDHLDKMTTSLLRALFLDKTDLLYISMAAFMLI